MLGGLTGSLVRSSFAGKDIHCALELVMDGFHIPVGPWLGAHKGRLVIPVVKPGCSQHVTLSTIRIVLGWPEVSSNHSMSSQP